MENPPFLQLFPQDAGQRAALGLGEVRHTELGGVQLIPGPHGREDGNGAAPCGLNQIQLAGDQINGVYDVIIRQTEELVTVRRLVFFGYQVEDTVGIDVLDALGHGGGFLQPKGGVKGFRLAIQVGESHLVVVH